MEREPFFACPFKFVHIEFYNKHWRGKWKDSAQHRCAIRNTNINIKLSAATKCVFQTYNTSIFLRFFFCFAISSILYWHNSVIASECIQFANILFFFFLLFFFVGTPSGFLFHWQWPNCANGQSTRQWFFGLNEWKKEINVFRFRSFHNCH